MRKLSKNELLKLYDKSYVNKYHKDDNLRISRLFEFIVINKTQSVLDLGCGNGLLLDYLNGKVKYYYGIDFLEDFIELSKKKAKDINFKNAIFIQSDIEKFLFKNKRKFDKIFSLDFTEHIYDKDFQKIFSLVYNNLKENGELYIHTPNKNYILEIFKKIGILKQLPEHIGIRNSVEYQKLLKKSGFNHIRIIYLSHYIKILSLFDFLKYIPFFGKYFEARLFIICRK